MLKTPSPLAVFKLAQACAKIVVSEKFGFIKVAPFLGLPAASGDGVFSIGDALERLLAVDSSRFAAGKVHRKEVRSSQ